MASRSKVLREVFDEVDADRSGTIDLEEVRSSLRRLGMKYDDDAVANLVKRVDVDGNGKIDFNEWQVARTGTLQSAMHQTLILCTCAVRISSYWCLRLLWTPFSTIGRILSWSSTLRTVPFLRLPTSHRPSSNQCPYVCSIVLITSNVRSHLCARVYPVPFVGCHCSNGV